MNVSTLMPMELAHSILGNDYQRIATEYGHPIYWIDGSPFADEKGLISLSFMFLYPTIINPIKIDNATKYGVMGSKR